MARTTHVPTTVPASNYPTVTASGVTLSTNIVAVDADTYAYAKVNGKIPASTAHVTIELSTEYTNAEIRYTTNGKAPNAKSKLYDGPLTFVKNLWSSDRTVIKARAYDITNKVWKTKIIRVEFNVVNSAL
jgi:hypothetical protein